VKDLKAKEKSKRPTTIKAKSIEVTSKYIPQILTMLIITKPYSSDTVAKLRAGILKNSGLHITSKKPITKVRSTTVETTIKSLRIRPISLLL
jgi:hypothetical protein